ncbi:thaumatin [Gongronella butleri]|nr:thaumatin [Gongronella butleri]
MTNGQAFGTDSTLAKGQNKTYSQASNWSGRFFGREYCQGTNCTTAGAAAPASLAEFTFGGYGGNDFYDVSFVDGYNIPMEISPFGATNGTATQGKYNCGSPACATLPSCPDNFKTYDSQGHYIGCQSACSNQQTDAYCCTGANNTPQTCSRNSYAQQVKNVCPDVYTYAYDDPTSTFSCKAQGYDVIFCPKTN